MLILSLGDLASEKEQGREKAECPDLRNSYERMMGSGWVVDVTFTEAGAHER